MILKVFIIVILSAMIGISLGTISTFYYKLSIYNLKLTNTQKLNFIYKCLSMEYFKKYFFSTPDLNKFIIEKIKEISKEYNYKPKNNMQINKDSNIKNTEKFLITFNTTFSYNQNNRIEIKEFSSRMFETVEDINIHMPKNNNEVKTWKFRF